MGRACWLTGRGTTTCTSACGGSWFGVTRCPRAAPVASVVKRCSVSLACFGSAAFILAPRRVPWDEARRKAGCGKSEAAERERVRRERVLLGATVDALLAEQPIVCVIHGAARGAD